MTDDSGDNSLRQGGVQFNVMYIGFTGVKHPVHDMTNDMREMLFETEQHVIRYTFEALGCLKAGKPTPLCNSVLSLIIDPPKLTNKKVLMTVSAKNIAITYDDESVPEKMGNLIARYPMKYVSVIKCLGYEHIALIAKQLNGKNRRCCLFNAVTTEATGSIMSVLEKAIQISSEDVNAERLRLERERNENASGNATPVLSQPPVALPEHREEVVRPRRQAPLNIDRIIPGRRAAELAQYRWYHGILSRVDAENSLQNPGEFLIRESPNQQDQVILSGMNDKGELKHLFLIDPDGNVKTENHNFGSVAELVNWYLANRASIIMADNPQICLTAPVDRPH